MKEQRRTLRAMGMTLFAVVASVGTTVGFGMSGPWWARAAAGTSAAIVLVILIKVATTEGSRGGLARAADWITGSHSGADE